MSKLLETILLFLTAVIGVGLVWLVFAALITARTEAMTYKQGYRAAIEKLESQSRTLTGKVDDAFVCRSRAL